MSMRAPTLVRKGKPAYVQRSEQAYEPRERSRSLTHTRLRAHPRSRNSIGAATEVSVGAYSSSVAGWRNAILQPTALHVTAASVSMPTMTREVPRSRSIVTAAATASLRRHKDLARCVAELMRMLTRSSHRLKGPGGAAAAVAAPPGPEELRPILDAIRDHCVAANNRTKIEGPAASRTLAAASREEGASDDLNGFYAVTFLSTLSFPAESEEMLREALQSVTDRLRTAGAHGREDLYHNAVVEAVNQILLFTPLTAPPMWLLAGQRRSAAVGAAIRRAPGRADVGMGGGAPTPTSAAAAGRHGGGGGGPMAAADAAMEDVAALVRSVLYRLDFGEYGGGAGEWKGRRGSESYGTFGATPMHVSRRDGAVDEEAASSAEVPEEGACPLDDASRAVPGILEDDCLDYLNSDAGAPALDEQRWFDVWLSSMLERYVHVTAAALVEGGADVGSEGSNSVGDEVSDTSASTTVPTLLPRPVWRDAANNAYAQFAVQLLAIFFSRASDGSLNYCARVHKLVQYYHHRMRGESVGCTPIPTRVAARPVSPPPRPARSPCARVADRLEKEVQTVSTTVPASAPAPAPPSLPPRRPAKAETAGEGGRGGKQVLLFHPSVERSRRRADRDATPEDELEFEPDPVDPEVQESPTAGHRRQHKCFTAAEDPDSTLMRRIPVEDPDAEYMD